MRIFIKKKTIYQSVAVKIGYQKNNSTESESSVSLVFNGPFFGPMPDPSDPSPISDLS